MPNYSKKRTTKTYKKKSYKRVGGSSVKKQINRALIAYTNKNVEVKRSTYSSTDGTEIAHNNFITLDSNVLRSTQGTADPQNSQYSCRIGDEIKLRGVSFKMMLELNERYSDVTYRVILVKCAKGDTPARTTLFTGLTGNKMLDTFNSERYTILYNKIIKLRAPTSSTFGGLSGFTGVNTQTSGDTTISRSTKIVKVWIPYKAFTKSGVLKYEPALEQVKFYDYKLLLYAYSNYSTNQDLYYVGRCNDYIRTMYFTDQ